MSIKDITKKILDDARADAEETVKGADVEVQKIEEETKRLVDVLEGDQVARLDGVADRTKQERAALYRQKIKARLDREKRLLLEGAFEKALESAVREGKARDLLKDQVGKLNIGKDAVVIDVPRGETESVKKAVGNAVKNAKYVETKAVASGCVIRTGGAEYDFTLESMIQDKKQALEAEVAKILFEKP